MNEALTTHALLDLRSVSEPRLANARVGVAVVSDVVKGSGSEPPRVRSRLLLLDPSGAAAPRFVTHGARDRHPRFSPDGRRLAFLRRGSEAGAVDQLLILDLAGGEPLTATSLARGVSTFVWESDATLLLLSRGARRDEGVAQGLGRVIDRRGHRFDGVGFLPESEIDLLRLDPGGEPSLLGTLPFAPSEFAFSPAAQAIAYFAPADADEADRGVTRLWQRSVGEGWGEPIDLFGAVLRGSSPSFSPDGRAVAFLASADPLSFGRGACLWVAAPGVAPRRLSDGVDLAPAIAGDNRLGAFPTTPRWNADGRSLLALAGHEGRSALVTVDPAGVAPLQEVADRVVTAFDGDATLALFVAEDARTPGEVFVRRSDGVEVRLTHCNDAFVARFALAGVEERRAPSRDGTLVPYFWWASPQPRDDRAVVVQVHGGPHTADGFGFRFEYQRLLAAGYAVVALNPRGSTTYGDAFATAALHGYGGVDAEDVMAVVDHALGQHARPDAPVHLTGGSYGGFMTNWLVGTVPDRFRSAVTQRSICNWISFHGTADIGPYFTEGEVGPAPWENLQALWQASPLAHVAQVRTPILVLHSEADYRCPIEQAEQWFSALKRIGRAETRLVRFPDEGHELSRSGRPDRRMQRIDLILDWFERHP
jgi:dipeptidyl aminopeptidase/acylaminoacyl peptidase